MKSRVSGLAALLITIAAHPAGAQTAAQSVRQARPAQAAQPALATPATAVAKPAASAAQMSQYATAGKKAIPSNLFGVEDRAIIIVGGQPVAAGDVKRQLVNELRQQSTPATSNYRRVPAAPQGVPVRENPGGIYGNSIGGGINPKLRPQSVYDKTKTNSARVITGRQSITNERAPSYTEQINYCKTHPAEISRVRGTVTPNGRFTIEGMCFGDQTGDVEVIGQFPGGNMKLAFEGWSDGLIKAFFPPVSGATDHILALTVVRPDKTRSPAIQARFIATRQQVPVPARYWSPNSDFLKIEVDQGGGNIFSGFTVWGAGHESRVTPFTLLINKACELDSAAWSSRTGSVEAFNGWENGPPYQANVDVVWTPRCVTHTTNYVVASSSQRVCSIDFTLSAWANCPVGVSP